MAEKRIERTEIGLIILFPMCNCYLESTNKQNVHIPQEVKKRKKSVGRRCTEYLKTKNQPVWKKLKKSVDFSSFEAPKTLRIALFFSDFLPHLCILK